MASMERGKEPRGLWTVDQAAEKTGLKPKTIRQKVWRREIEYVRVGKKAIRFRPETIERLIEEGTVPALDQD